MGYSINNGLHLRVSMKELNVQGIVFDLDATLVNLGGFVEWRRAHEDIVKSYLKMDCDDETVHACSAKGLFNMLDEMYLNLIDKRGEDGAKAAQDTVYGILNSYEEKGVEACTLMDGCVSTLDWVKERGVPMGICTSNSTNSAMSALKLQGLEHYFGAVVGRTVGLPMKPHPAQLEECFRLLGVNPSKGVMVGDSHKDIIAGKSAGAYTIGVPVYFTKLDLMKDAGVDVIIDNLHQLPVVLESL
jgi:phosphoglycolate phosphatase-like HAD superfamily hydrolase